MTHLKTQIRLSIALGILSLFAGVMGHLALTDIYHNDGDLVIEWNILRACAIVLLIFIGAALATLGKAMRALH